jgi:hypothetical protein
MTALVRSLRGDAVEPFGAYLFAPHDPGAQLARHVERSVFLEAFGNTPELLAQEYGPYEHSSLFLCVIDHLRGVPAGMMRVLTPSPAGFKSLNDLQSEWGEPVEQIFERTGIDVDQERTLDIATLAIAPEYRGRAATQGVVSMALYQTLTLAAGHCGADWFVAILDMPVFRLLRWKLRMIFSGYQGVTPRPYLGSQASVPAWCDVRAAASHLAETDPTLYEVLVLGEGLEPVLRSADLSAAALPLAAAGALAGA